MVYQSEFDNERLRSGKDCRRRQEEVTKDNGTKRQWKEKKTVHYQKRP